MDRTRRSFVAMALCLALPVAASAEELTAEQIASKTLAGNAFGWAGAKTVMRMVLADKDGKKSERIMEILARRRDGLLQSVVRFRSPPEVAGTAFLMLEQKDGGSEQHIYLPGLRRTRRIVGREREGSFMGSDFSYADMRRADTREATHKRLPDEALGGIPTYVVESLVKPETKSQYSKIQTWIRKSDFLPLRTRFFDKQGKLAKTLYSRRIKDIDGKPMVMEARMENHLNGHATMLIVDSIERRDDLADAQFTPTALEHP